MSEGMAQPVEAEAVVSLRAVTMETVGAVCRLRVAEKQRAYVAENAFSIAQAYFEDKAWFRAICAGETPVGFLMLSDDPDAPEYFLWRLMVDEARQGKGFGRQAIALLVEYVRGRPGARELLVSYHPGEDSPREFYLKQGFRDTGRIEDGEAVLSLALEG